MGKLAVFAVVAVTLLPGSAWLPAASVAILHTPELRPFWLADDESRGELARLLRAEGHELVESGDPGQWRQMLDQRRFPLVIYGPCEAVPEDLIQPIRNYLHNGGKIITGGGMAFFNAVAGRDGGYEVLRPRATGETLGVRHVLLPPEGEAHVTEIGRRILGDDAADRPQPYIRALATVPGGTAVVVPLVEKHGEAVASFVHYPQNGRLFFFGTAEPLHNSLLDPRSPAGQQRWRNIVHSIKQPQAELGRMEARRTFIIGQDRQATLRLRLSNPADQPVTAAGDLVMTDAAGNEKHREAMSIRIPAAGEALLRAELPLPSAAHEWDFYPVEFHADSGLRARTVLHVIPPAVAAYVDVDRIFDDSGKGEITLRIGLQKFADAPVDAIWRLEWSPAAQPPSAVPPQFTLIDEQPVRLAQRGVMRHEIRQPMPTANRLYRLTLLIDDHPVNQEHIRFEAGPRPALARPPIIGRSLNGHQFYSEPDLIERMKSHREQLPMVGEFSVARWEPPMLEMARSAGFDYMGQMHLIGPDGRNWNVGDFGPNGEDTYKGHGLTHQGEDKTLWMTLQLSRRYVDDVAAAGVDRVLFIEPGTTFAPGALGEYGPWFGYTPEATEAFRLALQGRDSGVRLLEPGGQRITRVHFAELWRHINDAPLPSPGQLGFRSWAEYEPYRIPMRNRRGEFADERELLAMKMHLTLRMYWNIWQIDQVTTYTRSLLPEVQVVLNTDGPRNGQYSPFLYRLPFIDTHQKQMFNSAYQWGAPTYFGGEPVWWLRMGIFGKRMRLRDEIGHGGNAVPYRTPETSFVAVFTKRAAMPGQDYEIHHYNLGHAEIRVREELAMWSGFSMAAELEAERYWEGQRNLLFLTINLGHYPELYRPFAVQGRHLAAAEALRRAGVEYDAVELPFPVAPWEHLDQYRTIVVDAAAQGAGTFEALRAWLDEPAPRPRTLVLNNIQFLHVTTGWGATPEALRVLKPNRWRDIGLPQRDFAVDPRSSFSFADQPPMASPQPIPVFFVPPPPRAEVLVRCEQNQPVVWRVKLPNGNAIIYSGLPLNVIGEQQDPQTIAEQLWVRLFTELLHYPRRITCSVPETFAGLYRIAGDVPVLALISHHEARMIRGVNYQSEQELLDHAASLPKQEVTVTIRGLEPNARWQLFDIAAVQSLGNAESDADGTVELKTPLHLVKLIALAPPDAGESELAELFGRYTELWK